MAEFSEAESELLGLIPGTDPLRTNLAEIREAVEKIWSVEAPRVIQDFTDHGIKHYERLAGYAVKLLKANQGKGLSNEEAYLLLAGIYIHDIGMQCDLVRFPEIKERATDLGAKFETENFKADRANNYSLEEQKDIRKNHHWLSIAWVDVARKDSNNELHQAASGIPRDLVRDLKDVAVHHTKLAIGSCPVPFTLDPNGRKQFVAALLRFSDELDIESNRVNIETVKMFSLSPFNSVYWWLHHQTKVTWPTQSLLNVSIALHPDDHSEFSTIVQDIFLNEFRTKNSPVLSVLAQNLIPIVMDDKSSVIAYEESEKLPDEIRATLQQMSESRGGREQHDPLMDLANEARLWLRAIRYEVGQDISLHGEVAEMIAVLDTGTVRQSVLVRSVARSISIDDVRRLDEKLNRKINQGWLISDQRVSDDVRRALHETGVLAFQLREFLEQLVWGPYIQSLTSLVENDDIPRLYVDIGCYRQSDTEATSRSERENYESLDQAVDEWLSARERMHVSLLGEFGSGKTWFCRHYAYWQLQKYLNNPVQERFPILITLRNFTKASTARELVTNAIVDQYQLSFVGDPFEVFDELNRRGKILLILDGFDEMARKVDKQTMVDNFWELAGLVHENSKVILTSRTEYFRWAKEAETVLGGEELGRKIDSLRPPKFDILYLSPFTDEQIRRVITSQVEGDGEQVADKLLGNDNLKEMARKPVLIKLLLAAAEETDADLLTDQAVVYLHATNKLLMRNISEQRTFTSTSDKLLFLCELAWKMIESGELRVHYKEIPRRIQQHFSGKIKGGNDLDHWDFDLRNQTLLRPDLEGYYEFSHKSLAEYFVALKFCSELGWLAPPFTNTYEEENGRKCDMPYSTVGNEQLAETFGRKNIGGGEMYAVRVFMSQMIRDEAEPLARVGRLREFRSTGFFTANVLTLLSDSGYLADAPHLSGLDMGEAVLRSSQIRDKDVDNSVLSGTTIYIDDARHLYHGCIGHGKVTGLPVIAAIVIGQWDLLGISATTVNAIPWEGYDNAMSLEPSSVARSSFIRRQWQSLREGCRAVALGSLSGAKGPLAVGVGGVLSYDLRSNIATPTGTTAISQAEMASIRDAFMSQASGSKFHTTFLYRGIGG